MNIAERAPTSRTILIFFAALFFSSLVLNRWIVTDLGVQSFGRVWQFYVTYSDFGFFRRGLIGTILSEIGLNSIISNEYYFSIFFHQIALVALTFLLGLYCLRKRLFDPVFLIGVAFSPALIIHSGYATGALDVFVLILALVNILYVRGMVAFCAIVVVGIFTHELFIFTLPAQFFAYYLHNGTSFLNAKRATSIIPVIFAGVAIAAIVIYGRMQIPQPVFDELMRQKMPNAFEKHPFWSGYIEISSSVGWNLGSSKRFLAIIENGGAIYFIIPIIYVAFLVTRAVEFVQGSGRAVFLTFAVIAPLLTSIVATDFHRWIAMSANMAILLTLQLAAQERRTYSKWNIPIALFCLVAPFGSADLDRPFPLHQFIFERFTSSQS